MAVCIQLHPNAGLSYASGAVTVSELAERYISQKLGVRYNTRKNYNFILNLLKKEEFGYLPIRDIRPSDAKAFCIKLHEDGKSYSTVAAVRGVLKPAFEVAADDEIIRRNPYLMGHSDVDTTLNIYTHSSYETAAQAFGKVEPAKDKGVEQVEA